ncbi:MAG TPA: AbrB/MazE/SpoVT family DNA-binding domain-containing protein [Thiolapillus brandeum]|uniref:AbrB/MazE/SpoVT family DNA-binding domain-containing protein n=1 Tax=Thiolapillus brandeum TaxID=1076588 RepID=A0A7C5MVZ2_9GAMM|nr:AbrB/MazE/SpoVT family DNA-binding domain-containing protein [Thiolapillus brandeum]
MTSVTLSSKFQLVIPKAVREQLHLQAGQRFTVITKGDVIELVPMRDIASARGMLKGADPQDYRDRRDRD